MALTLAPLPSSTHAIERQQSGLSWSFLGTDSIEPVLCSSKLAMLIRPDVAGALERSAAASFMSVGR